MKLAYLLNSYPMTSTTFIRREIEAIEAAGHPVTRFSVRHWDTALVDPDDIAEQGRTEYLLTGNVGGLIAGALTEPFLNLPRLAGTLPLWRHVQRAAGGGVVKPVNYLLQAIYLRRRARALGITHIHAHFSTNAATVAMLAHRLGGPGYSFTVHGPDELVDPPANALARKVAESRFVAAITRYCRGRILAEAPAEAERVRIIPCGIDLSDFVPTPEAPAAARRLVCVGRLCPNKAQTLIPAAVALIRPEFPDMVVDLIGDGEDRPAIEAEIARLGLGDNIRLLGWAAAPAVRDHIRASAALLLPSYAEGLPIVLMEALALERPVLTTTIAGIPELVDGACGWLFPSGSVEAMADAMRAALSLSPDQRAAMGREGRRRVAAHHDVNGSARLLIEAFEQTGTVTPDRSR